jgi:hypothetical protein
MGYTHSCGLVPLRGCMGIIWSPERTHCWGVRFIRGRNAGMPAQNDWCGRSAGAPAQNDLWGRGTATPAQNDVWGRNAGIPAQNDF